MVTTGSDEKDEVCKKTSPEAVASERKMNKREIPEFKLRLMKPEDIPRCLNIFREHQLPELSYGIYTYRTLEPDGSWVAEDTKSGERSMLM